MGIHVNSEDYGISHTCYPYTPILLLLLQTSLSLSYLLHNSMSQDLFGEASKHRNKKQEEKRKFRKIGREISLMISSTLSIYSVSEWRQTLEMGLGDVPPPRSIYFSLTENSLLICVCLELNQQVEFSC